MALGIRNWLKSLTIWEKGALGIWVIMLLAVGGRVFVSPESRTVYPIFSYSARFWWSGIDLYFPYRPMEVQTGFRYSPTFAILLTPFAIFPDAIGGVLWRWFGAAVFLGSLAWWARAVLPQVAETNNARSWFGILALLVIPLSLPSVNNGQANVLVTGLLLATIAAVAEKRWNLASLLIGLTFICKLYPLALGMILVVLYPRQLLGRLVLVLGILLALPFLCQSPAYVIDQYGKWIASLKADNRSYINIDSAYRDLWLLIRLYEIPISRSWYELGQVISGAALAGLCWYRRKSGWTERKLLTETLALVTAWMLLLGPSTESCTFILMAPSLAWAGVSALLPPRSFRHLVPVLACSLLLLGVGMACWLPAATALHARGFHSWATLIWILYLLIPEGRSSFSLSLSPAGNGALLRE